MKKALIVLLTAFIPLIFYSYAGAITLTGPLYQHRWNNDSPNQPLPPPDFSNDNKPGDFAGGNGRPGHDFGKPGHDGDNSHAGWNGGDNWHPPIDLDHGHDAPAPVPEPATMLLLGSGLVGLATLKRKLGKKS